MYVSQGWHVIHVDPLYFLWMHNFQLTAYNWTCKYYPLSEIFNAKSLTIFRLWLSVATKHHTCSITIKHHKKIDTPTNDKHTKDAAINLASIMVFHMET